MTLGDGSDSRGNERGEFDDDVVFGEPESPELLEELIENLDGPRATVLRVLSTEDLSHLREHGFL